MTTRSEMQTLQAASRQVVAALREIGAADIADRLERCAVGRCHRVVGRRQWVCRSAGCPWCCRPMIARWQTILSDQIGDGDDVSTVVVHLGADDGDLRVAVRAIRRAVRDLRDRAGRRRRAWRRVSVAGMLLPRAAGRIVALRVRHDGLTRSEVSALFRGRWSGTKISASQPMPHVAAASMPLADRVALAVTRRGVEPLRVTLAPQGERSSRLRSDTYIEPMPMLV